MSAQQGEGPVREAPVERTVLSWNRAALVVGTNGALLVRIGDIRSSDLIDAAGAAVIAAGVGLWLLSLLRYSALDGSTPGHLLAGHPRAIRTIAAFAALVSLIELVVAATSRP